MVTHEPVDPELLAALLDGRLEGEERQAAIAHVMRSPEAFEAFAEAMRIQRDLEAEAGDVPEVSSVGETTADAESDFQAARAAGPGAEADPDPAPAPDPPVVSVFPPVASEVAPVPPSMREARPRRRFRGVTAGLALAAVLAGVLLIPRLFPGRGSDPGPLALLDGATLVSSPGDGSLDRALPPGWEQPEGWPATRGGAAEGTNGTLERNPPIEFQAGVRAAQVEVALDARDGGVLRRAQARLDSVLVQLDVGSGTRDEYRQLGLASSEADRVQAADRLTGLFRDLPWFDLGVRMEQGRLAALVGRTDFFDSAFSRAVGEISNRVAAEREPDDGLVRELRELVKQVRDGVSTTDELEMVKDRLTTVIRLGAR